MKQTLIRAMILTTLIASVTGCANMSQRQKDATIGAAIGGVAGSVLTGGDTLGTIGGAAIGGVIGNGGIRK